VILMTAPWLSYQAFINLECLLTASGTLPLNADIGRLLFANLRNTKMPADLLSQEIGNLRVAGHSFDCTCSGIRPERVVCAFAFQSTARFA